jgi:hypothetical protein
MRKLLILIVTLSLGTFALGQTMGSNAGDMQGAGNDWYNQQLAAQVHQFQQIAAATSADRQLEGQTNTLPASMAANAGDQAGNDWYNQRLAGQVQEFQRIAATTAPAATPHEQ